MNYLVMILLMSGALMHYPAVADIKGFSVDEDGEGVITKGKLMWMRCSMGQTWAGRSCIGESENYTWDQAMALRPAYAGHSDWRLPTRDELLSIRYCSHGEVHEAGGFSYCSLMSQKPTVKLRDFPNTPEAYFWSATPFEDDADYAWFVWFVGGFDGFYPKSEAFAVRLVRGH